jgi:hypothetical protein
LGRLDLAQSTRSLAPLSRCRARPARGTVRDSCPMGGFEPEAVTEALHIDRARYEVALLVALGYRAQPQPARHRLSLNELVEYR